MNKTAIRTLLAGIGITGVVTTKKLAGVLKMSVRTISAAKIKGELRQIDRNTFDQEAIVEWLYNHPRYIARIND